MSAIKGFIFKYKKGLTFFILLFISFSLLLYSNKKITINLKNTGFSLFYPFQLVFHSVGKFIENSFNSIALLKESNEEISRLRKELEEIKKAAVSFKELQNENENLNKLLNLKNNIEYESIACEVIGRDPKKVYDVLILNKGKNNGIEKNMPVVTYQMGKRVLVGKIFNVTSYASKVMTVHNPNFSVGAVIDPDNIFSVIEGDVKEVGVVKLNYIPKTFQFDENKTYIVLTSGDSYIYPKGIEIGRLTRVYPSKRYDLFKVGDVSLSVNLYTTSYVLVLIMKNKDQSLEVKEEKLN